MKTLTQKNIYLAVVAGVSGLVVSPAFAAIVNDPTTRTWNIDDHAEMNVDSNNGGLGSFFITDFNNDTGARNTVLSVDADDGISGNHQSATNSTTWTFDENGFSDNINDAPGGGTNVNATIRNATSTTNLITDGSDVSARFQNASGQVDAATDTTGINVGSRVQTKFGQTDTASIAGGSTATRAQTATTQRDEIVNGTNSNRLVSTVGGTTRTVAGAGGTTVVSQDDRDFIASTGAGAGSARVAVQRSGGAGNAAAELSVTNSAGNTHGVFVGENSTRISGGTNSTSLTFDDNGAHFRNDSTGGPARVTGVADGVADFDAVNFRQLNNLDKKLTGKINETGAIAAAMTQLGQSQTPGKSTFGIAAGGQGGKASVALGFSHRPVTMKPVVIKGSLGASGKTVAGGIGATWEF